MKKISSYILFAVAAAVSFSSCKKNNLVVDNELVPPSVVKFNTHQAADTIGRYLIRSVGNSFKIPVGITAVEDRDRTIQFTYTSRTAVQGTQYTAPTSLVIPAGKALDSLTIQGLLSGYPLASRVDTVKIQITGGDVPVSAYKNTYYVIIRKYCDVNINSFAGVYRNTREMFSSAYGPYITNVTVVSSTATTARISVTNIWDTGWGPIEFDLDWSDPANFKAAVVAKSSGIGDAGDISSTYAGKQVAVRPFSGSDGTFSSCEGTLTLRMQLGVAGVGFFGTLYTVTLAR